MVIAQHYTPIFCTAEIEPSTIDDFLNVEWARRKDQGIDDSDGFFDFFLVTSELTPPSTPKERATLFLEGGINPTHSPVGPFSSPYIGCTLSEITEVWRSFYFGEPFNATCFIVLDERTKRDRSVRVYANFRREETARCEFGVASETLLGPESSEFGLNEGIRKTEFVDSEGNEEHFYSVEERTRVLGWYLSSPNYRSETTEEEEI